MSSRDLQDPRSSYLTRSWDFSRIERKGNSSFVAKDATSVVRSAMSPHVDTCGTQVAQIGARLVVGELAKILSMSAKGRVAKIESPSGTGSDWHFDSASGCNCIQRLPRLPTLFSDALSDLHDEACAMHGIEWHLATAKPARAWHPAMLD